MNKEFIPYEQALTLKELGFDENYIAFYSEGNNNPHIGNITEYHIGYKIDCFKAPLYQQAFRWFRDKHGLYTEFFISDDKTFSYMITSFIEEGRLDRPIRWGFTTYEDAEFDCLKKFTELVKQKQLLTDIMEADQKDGLYDNQNKGGN